MRTDHTGYDWIPPDLTGYNRIQPDMTGCRRISDVGFGCRRISADIAGIADIADIADMSVSEKKIPPDLFFIVFRTFYICLDFADITDKPGGYERISADAREIFRICADVDGYGRICSEARGGTRIGLDVSGYHRIRADPRGSQIWRILLCL